MATCFLFVNHFDENNCLSLRINTQGQIDAPLLSRSLTEFKTLQENHKTWIILNSDLASLHEVELPWLGERKARSAIPYALEEEVAQNVSSLHFVFDKAHYQNNRYLVAVLDKSFLTDLITQIEEHDIAFDLITLDWFGLKNEEVCFTPTNILVNSLLYKGALNRELAAYFFDKFSERAVENQPSILVFKDSISSDYLAEKFAITQRNESYFVWLATRLFSSKPLNFCQGTFARKDKESKIRLWYWVAGASFGLLVLTTLITNLVQLWLLNNAHQKIDKQIAAIYYQFFPEAKQVVSPQFRISSLLEKGKKQTDAFWELLGIFAAQFRGTVFSLEQIRFQNNVLSVTLLSNDFAALEDLQLRLKNAGVQVMQAQASSQDQKVLATLDITL